MPRFKRNRSENSTLNTENLPSPEYLPPSGILHCSAHILDSEDSLSDSEPPTAPASPPVALNSEDPPSSIKEVAFQTSFKLGAKPDRILCLNSNTGVFTDSSVRSMSNFIHRLFEILSSDSDQFLLHRARPCACQISADTQVNNSGILHRARFLEWASLHTEPKSKCPLGIFFRQIASPKSRFYRLSKFVDHDRMLSHEWRVMICGVSYTTQPTEPEAQPVATLPRFTEVTHGTNQLMVPNVIAEASATGRNKERGNTNALQSINRFLPQPEPSRQIEELDDILSSYHALFMKKCFQNRIKAVRKRVPMTVYDQEESVLTTKVNSALSSLVETNISVEAPSIFYVPADHSSPPLPSPFPSYSTPPALPLSTPSPPPSEDVPVDIPHNT